MIKMATQGMNSMSEWFEKNPELVTGLVTGGLGALGGFAMTGKDPDEEEGETFKRRLKNALIVGGLAGGAGALGASAFNSLSSSHPYTSTDRALEVTRRIGLDAAGTAGGAYGGYALGKKLINSKLPGGYGAEIQAMAKNLGLAADTHPDVILARIRQEAANGAKLDRLNKIFGTTDPKALAKKLKLFGVKEYPGIVPGAKGTKGFFEVMNRKGFKINRRTAIPAAAAAALGLLGGWGTEWAQNNLVD